MSAAYIVKLWVSSQDSGVHSGAAVLRSVLNLLQLGPLTQAGREALHHSVSVQRTQKGEKELMMKINPGLKGLFQDARHHAHVVVTAAVWLNY
jgi:hypothetical protein